MTSILTQATDFNNIKSIINSFQENNLGLHITTEDKIRGHLSQMEQLKEEGFPIQEIAFDDDRCEAVGVPVDLACIVLAVLEYCSENRIDIVGALKVVTTKIPGWSERDND